MLDRGFIFGDGIYEVIPVYGRRLFRFDEHMARLARSLDKLRIANPHSRDEWLSAAGSARRFAERGGATDQLGLHPGHARRRAARPRDAGGIDADRVHDGQPDEAGDRPSSAITVWPASARATSAGSAATSRASRCSATCWRGRCRPIATRSRPSCSATASSPRRRRSNVWVVHEGAVLGPPKSEHVLEGIRYELIKRAVRGMRHRLQPAPDPRGRRRRRRRVPAQLGDQGNPAGDRA